MVFKDVPNTPDEKVQVCFKISASEAERLETLASNDHRTRAGFVKKLVLDHIEAWALKEAVCNDE